MKADVNVIDLENLSMDKPFVAHDLPAGAPRWMQDVSGYDMTIINGVVTFEGNIATGALPGTLVRNPRTQSVRDAGQVSEVDLDAVYARRGPATRPLIGRPGNDDGNGASAIARRFREDLALLSAEMSGAAGETEPKSKL